MGPFLWNQLNPDFHILPSVASFYARQLYRQVLLRARISYGISVRPSVCLSVRHDPVVYQAQVR